MEHTGLFGNDIAEVFALGNYFKLALFNGKGCRSNFFRLYFSRYCFLQNAHFVTVGIGHSNDYITTQFATFGQIGGKKEGGFFVRLGVKGKVFLFNTLSVCRNFIFKGITLKTVEIKAVFNL